MGRAESTAPGCLRLGYNRGRWSVQQFSARAKSGKKTQTRGPRGSLSSPGNRKTLLLGLVLAVATIALYVPVHSYPFVNYDDELYVTYNDHVKAGLTLETVKWAFTSFDASNWHPLTWVSHALDYQLFQLDAGGCFSWSSGE